MHSTIPATPLQNAPNFRSMAGILTADGRAIREGVLFRSEILSRLSPEEIAHLSALNIGLVCDLRSPRERERESNRWPHEQNVRTVVRQPDPNAVRTDWETRLLEQHFDEEQARQYMMEAYRAMPRELAGHLVALLDYCGHAEPGGILIHCVAGKDRTGFVCAMLLSALGVPLETILADYMESAQRFMKSERMIAALQKTFDADIPARAYRAVEAIGTVRMDYLEAAFGEIERTHGSIEAYLASVAGLDNARLAQLQRHLLAP